jgi:hypothetical protein
MKRPDFKDPMSHLIRDLVDERDFFRLITTILSIMLIVSIAYNVYLEAKIDKFQHVRIVGGGEMCYLSLDNIKNT